LLHRCDQVDDDHASSSTRRADSFRRAVQATKGTATTTIHKIALNPLRHRGFTLAIMSDDAQVGKRVIQTDFSIDSRIDAIP
jgi:hypothetical protein